MKTDRELLELAARAVGIKARWFKVNIWKDGVGARFHVGTKDVFGTHHAKPWNPLTDDGDALRLAVALGVIVDCRYGDKPGSHTVYVNYWPKGYTGVYLSVYEESEDQLSATRRAIVRAAAEIGESMK